MSSDIEIFMYNIMTSLYRMNAPIVFKGAMVLKAIQYKYGNPSGLERETHDIDGDWIGQTPSMEYLRNLVQQAVVNAGYRNIRVDIKREYSESKSAGFNFYNLVTNDIEVSMDLSIKPNNTAENYSFVNGISFYGQNILKVLADKVVPVSQRVIMRRIKDIRFVYFIFYMEG